MSQRKLDEARNTLVLTDLTKINPIAEKNIICIYTHTKSDAKGKLQKVI